MTRSQPRRGSVDLTLVITMADAGRRAHPTFRNLDAAVEVAVSDGWTVEVVIVVDGERPRTDEYLRDHLAEFFAGAEVRRIDVDNHDLGLSRNSGAAVARGRFVAFSDDDNLYSRSWLTAALRRLSSGPGNEIVHPAVVITFEARNDLWHLRPSTGPGFDSRTLAEHNLWDAACVTPRDAVLEVPYAASLQSPGFGPEDWHWNIQTLDSGWSHVLVPETVMFYRVKMRGSLLSVLESRSVLLAPAPFLTRRQPDPALTGPVAAPRTRSRGFRALRTVGRAGWGALRWAGRLSPRLRKFAARLRPAIAELVSPPVVEDADAQAAKLRESFPGWLRADWRDAHRYEPGLFPARDLLKSMGRWTPDPTSFTRIYWHLVNRMSFDGEPPEYVFLVPWLIPGGATTVVANYLLAIREADPGARIAVLVTTPRPSDVPSDPRLAGVRFVDLPLSFAGLHATLQERLISSLIVQFGPRVVHLINAHVGYRSFARHHSQLSSRSRLFISLFTIDEDAEGRMVHPVLDSLLDYVDALSGIFVDNTQLRDRLATLYALPESRFTVHFQPTVVAEKVERRARARAGARSGRLSVLWAARLDLQKRPDILVAVAERAQELDLPIDFYVSGMTVLEERPQIVDDLAAAGVELLGPYDDSIASLGRTFDVLLNTSQWEGLPLVLVDAALNDLTIVAAPVGGVVDFVEDSVTGFLVDRFDAVDEYVALLARLAKSPELVGSTRSAAKRLAHSRHTWGVFTANLRSVVGYLP